MDGLFMDMLLRMYKILKIQKPNLIYIYHLAISDANFRRLTSLKKKQKTIGNEMFRRLKFNCEDINFFA